MLCLFLAQELCIGIIFLTFGHGSVLEHNNSWKMNNSIGLANSDMMTKEKYLTKSLADTFLNAAQNKSHFNVLEGVSNQELLESLEFNFIFLNTQQCVTQHKNYVISSTVQNTPLYEFVWCCATQYKHMTVIIFLSPNWVESTHRSYLLYVVARTATCHKTGLSVIGQLLVLYIQAEHDTDTPKLQDDICRVHRAKTNLFDKPDGILVQLLQYFSNRENVWAHMKQQVKHRNRPQTSLTERSQ